MYGYAYRYSGRPNGVLAFNPLTDINGLSLYLNKNTNVNTKLSQSLDGASALNADALVGDLASTTTGIWAGWVKPVDATPVAQEVFVSLADTTGSSQQIRLFIETSGILRIFATNGTATRWLVDTSSAAFTNNTWTHIAVLVDGINAPLLYVNGITVGQTVITSTEVDYWINDATLLDNMRFGSRRSNGAAEDLHFGGDMDEWGIWDNDSSVTIASLYNSGAGKTLADLTTAEQVGLVGYYTLNDYLDTSGNSNTLTAIGTPTVALGKVQDVSTVGERVWNWIDQSSNQYIFNQDTVTAQPLLGGGGSVDFDGVDDSLEKTIANVYIADTSGIIFFSGYFDSSAHNYIMTSSDTATNNYEVYIAVLSTGVFRFKVNNNTSTNIISATNTISNGAYYYGYIKSTGSAYEINLNGVIETLVFSGGLAANNGHWWDFVGARDNIAVGYLDRPTPIYAPSKINKLIYSNDYTIDTAPILNFMSDPNN